MTPGRLAKIIWHAKTRRKPEQMAFFEKHFFENAIFLGFQYVKWTSLNALGKFLTRNRMRPLSFHEKFEFKNIEF
jgi:hypothetical protein